MQKLRDILARGEAALREGRAEEAFALASEAREIRPNFAPIVAFVIRCALASDRHQAAWDAADHLALLQPDSKAAADAFRAAGAGLGREAEGARRSTDIYAVIGRKGTSALAGKLGGLFRKKASDPVQECLSAAMGGGLSGDQKRHLQGALDRMASGETDAARQHVGPLEAEFPDHPSTRLFSGVLALEEARYRDALDALGTCRDQGPDAAALYARAAVRCDRPDLAEAALAGLSERDRQRPLARLAAAELAQQRGEGASALEIARALEKDHPDHRSAQLLAGLHGAAGAFAEAARWHEATAERAPWAGRPFYAAAVERQLKPDTPFFAEAEARAARADVPQAARGYLHFALGRALQGAGRHDEAFDHFATGNALTDRWYDAAEEEARVAAEKAGVTAAVLARAVDGARGRGIVSVCGMPRSGSTLAAQILASHPDAVSVGEAYAFDTCLQEARAAGYPEKAAELGDDFYAALGERYLSLLPEWSRGAKVVVDKALFTHRHLGLFRLMLPGARVVHSVRDPRDVCFSIFCQRFEGGHGYSGRLETLAHFARLHDEIMAHWRATMGEAIHTLRYEDVVADAEGETRRLLDFVGLPFDPACLDFSKSEQQVTTSSAYQVRQKVYGSSVGAWKRHEARLGPLLAGLEA